MPKDNNGKGKRTRKTNKNQDREDDQPEHIPRPPNSWILFRRYFNAQLQRERQQTNSKGLHQNTVSGNASQAWKALSDEERAYWDRKADEAKEEHLLQYPGYRYKPRAKKQKASASPVPSGSMDPLPSSSTVAPRADPEHSAPRRRHRVPRPRSQSTSEASGSTPLAGAAGLGGAPSSRPNTAVHHPPEFIQGSSSRPLTNSTPYLPQEHPHEHPFVLPPLPPNPPLTFTSTMLPWELTATLSPAITSSSQEFSPVIPQAEYVPSDWQGQGAGPSSSNASYGTLHHPPTTTSAQSGAYGPEVEEFDCDAFCAQFTNDVFDPRPQ